MSKEIKNLVNQIITELEDSNWSRQWDEGFLSIPLIWDNVTTILSSKDINKEVLKDFYDKDPIIIQEVKKHLLKALKTTIYNSLEKNWDLLDEKNDII